MVHPVPLPRPPLAEPCGHRVNPLGDPPQPAQPMQINPKCGKVWKFYIRKNQRFTTFKKIYRKKYLTYCALFSEFCTAVGEREQVLLRGLRHVNGSNGEAEHI